MSILREESINTYGNSHGFELSRTVWGVAYGMGRYGGRGDAGDAEKRRLFQKVTASPVSPRLRVTAFPCLPVTLSPSSASDSDTQRAHIPAAIKRPE